MLRVALYTRSCADTKALEDQIQALLGNLGPEDVVVGTYQDRSPGPGDRPALGRALGCLKRGEVEALLVFSLDRLVRSRTELAEMLRALNEQGIGLEIGPA